MRRRVVDAVALNLAAVVAHHLLANGARAWLSWRHSPHTIESSVAARIARELCE